MTINAVFKPIYAVTSSIPTGASTGYITILGTNVNAVGTTYWMENDSASLRVTPATGYGILNVIVDSVGQAVTGTTYTVAIPNITSGHTVSASFTRSWTISPSTDGETGSISPANPVSVPNGGSKEIIITAATGSLITDVVIDEGTAGVQHLGAKASPYTHTFSNVTADHTIKGVFTTPASNIMSYCNVPSFLSPPLKPNLLLMLDTSASMYDLAYNSSAANSLCYDNTFSSTGTYYGYFTVVPSVVNYSYDFQNFKFVPGAARPTDCNATYSTAYFCLVTHDDTSTTPATTVVDGFWATGNFLNWLTASKLDQQKQILTGGNYDPTKSMLTAESRGCEGRRYIKAIPGFTGVTFGVRGPNTFDADYVSQATQGGGTRIEIMKGALTSDVVEACQAAIQNWMDPNSIGDVNAGGTGSNTSVCLGASGDMKSEAYIHVTKLCFRSLSGGSDNAELQALENNCKSLYDSLYGGSPALITNETAGDAICASSIPHAYYCGSASPVVCDQMGYIGQCYSSGTWDDTCAKREIDHYCAGAHAYDVTDPSNATSSSSGQASLTPSFIWDAGLAALGTPLATMNVNVTRSTAPTGLIQQFKDVIALGTMEFNVNGVGTSSGTTGTDSECGPNNAIKCAKACKRASGIFTSTECYVDSDCPSTQTCDYIPKLDGAMVTSHIGYDQIGDHGKANTLINRIDKLAPRSWTPLAEAYYNVIGYFANRSDLRLQTADFDLAKPPSQFTCQKNNVLLISDGSSTADLNKAVNDVATIYPATAPATGTSTGFCPTTTTTNSAGATVRTDYEASKNLDDLVKLASSKNIKTFSKTSSASSSAPVNDNEKILTYVVFTGKNGTATDDCTPSYMMDRAAKNGGTGQTSAFRASDYSSLQTSLVTVFAEVAKRATSGTAASILSNSEGSGANILQAIFYPAKTFDDLKHTASWIGELQDFWYYIDPFIGNSSVREDTDQNYALNLKNDLVAQFKFNDTKKQTEVILTKDTNGDGTGDAIPLLSSDGRFYQNTGDPNTYVSADDVRGLWRAGKTLWRSADPGGRNIYTQISGSLTAFTAANLDTNLQGTRDLLQATNKDEADQIIGYVRGDDTVNSTYRQRGLVIPSVDNTSRVWMLGDIISSTPRIQSSVRVNGYNLSSPIGYNDVSYGNDISRSGFIYSTGYQNRGMAYVGANDGMLHAFKMGKLDVTAAGDQKATLLKGTSGVLGKEEWAFIPKNALPYLKYLTDPGYPHLYYVDGTPTIVDASIGHPASCNSSTDYWECTKDNANGTNWKTILVGGMGQGGACRNNGSACNDGTTDCTNTPVDGLGFSSYFALDITNQTYDPETGLRDTVNNKPTVLWEFSDPELGYATSGVAIVKISAKNANGTRDNTKNGRWYGVFGSGPTGPMSDRAAGEAPCQFRGRSDQTLKIFIVDLLTGTLAAKIDTEVPYAFAGSIVNGTIDADRWNQNADGYYQDDAIYLSYVKRTGSGTAADPYTWTDGGVGRIMTNESLNPAGNTPTTKNWTWSRVIDGVGAVVTSISRLQDRKNGNLWLYFGTGRYYYNQDDQTSRRRIIGIKEPCYLSSNKMDPTCSSTIGTSLCSPFSYLTDKTTLDLSAPDQLGQHLAGCYMGNDQGWYITLDAQNSPDTGFGAERVITDAVALTNGAVFFTSFKPSGDPCNFGGKSFMWGVRYDTGGVAPAASLQGKALVQVSTGEFKEVDLGSALTAMQGRKMGTPMVGKPPGDPPPVLSKSQNKPIKRIIHMQER